MQQIIKHSGNFCMEVAKGLIGYGREIEQLVPSRLSRAESRGVEGGRGQMEASGSLPPSDGYATREADITLGGFLHVRVAQLATAKGTHLSALTVSEKQNLALRVMRAHLRQHGTVNCEHYRHWLTRVKAFAQARRIKLPRQNAGEPSHAYYRRLRAWVRNQPGQWPELRPAAGIHLILSPNPRIWPALRAKGMDERHVMNCILGHTLKEFADWRRKQYGPDHSLGWVAGTHARADGADRHPHIHLIVIKRDEAGQEVDFSVSCLKGRRGKDSQPDPMQELKRLFAKHVEKECKRLLGKETELQPKREAFRTPANPHEHQLLRGFRRIARAFRAVSRVIQPPRRHGKSLLVGHSSGWGTLLRMTALAQARVSNRSLHPHPSPVSGRSLRQIFQNLVRGLSRSTPDLEPSL